MRDDAATGTTSNAGRSALRTRFDSFRRARRRGPLGLAEVLALTAAAALLLLAVFAYLFLLVPQRSRLQSLEVERGDLQRVIQSTEHVVGGQKDTQQRASEILASLNNFQIEHLGQAGSAGNIIEELNRLILKNNLRISGGINFTQLQEAVPGAENASRARRQGADGEGAQRVVQSIFPGIGVTLTVEGTYPNLRRFIRDIEGDRRQFVVINTVELEGVSDTNVNETAPVTSDGGAPGSATAAPQTTSRGALVSLRLDMAAYFRRAAASDAQAQ